MRLALACAVILLGCEIEAPKSACGVRCSASGECPEDYACRLDGRCYLIGAPAEQSCVPAGDGDPPPRIVNVRPGRDEIAVATNAFVSVVFSEGVAGVDATTMRLASSGIPVSATVHYDTSGSLGTLVPSTPLRESTVYEVSVGPGISDYANNPIEPVQWSFMTVTDLGPPEITAMTPVDDAVGVDITTPISIRFSEAVEGISPASFYVTDANGVVPGTIDFFPQNAVRLTSMTRTPYTTYTFHLTRAIVDSTGNPLVGAPLAFKFTTGADTVAPTIIAQTPAPNDSNIPLSISISVRFSEPMIGASASTLILDRAGTAISGTVEYFPETRVARLTPSAPLMPHTAYAVKVTSGITDTTGNPVTSGTIVWAFTTGT
ncbi:MAG: Ig-like domain-containing protein [Kofleriaceae bacterium]|nr:Ig-like domain-containing protein [Kofleriaceae bacterium]